MLGLLITAGALAAGFVVTTWVAKKTPTTIDRPSTHASSVRACESSSRSCPCDKRCGCGYWMRQLKTVVATLPSVSVAVTVTV
jgi:hypothetical protein